MVLCQQIIVALVDDFLLTDDFIYGLQYIGLVECTFRCAVKSIENLLDVPGLTIHHILQTGKNVLFHLALLGVKETISKLAKLFFVNLTDGHNLRTIEEWMSR